MRGTSRRWVSVTTALGVVIAGAVVLAAGPARVKSASAEASTFSGPAELVAPRPARLGVTSTGAADRGKPERVREMRGERTAKSSSYVMSDGTTQLELSTDPVHYRADGQWRRIDTRVERGARGQAFTNKTNAFRTSFGRSTKRLARLHDQGFSIGLGVAGEARRIEPSASGSKVRFADVFGSADVRYQVSSEALKEDILIDDADGIADAYVFELDSDGLSPRAMDGGAIGLYADDASEPTFVLPAPYMYDASSDGGTGAVRQTVVERDGRTLLRLVPDADWLADPSRELPIVIDPTIVVAPDPAEAADTAIYSGTPTTNYGADSTIPVGRNASGVWRGLLRFPLAPAKIPAGADIRSADLRLHYSKPHAGDANEVPIQVRRLTKHFVENGATWNSMNEWFDSRSSFTMRRVDDSDTAYTSFGGDWRERSNVNAINGQQSVLPLDTGEDTFSWHFWVPTAGDYRVDVHYTPGPNRGTPTYQAFGDTGLGPKVGVDQTVAGSGSNGWEPNVTTHHFAPGETARVTMTRQAGTTATSPAADAVRLFEFGQQVKGAHQRDEWHEFAVTNFVQGWVNGTTTNFGFMVKAANESSGGPLGGPEYQASEDAFGGETRNRPQLVITYEEPGVDLDAPEVIHASGPELRWSKYVDPSPDESDNLVEYQIFRGCRALPDPDGETPLEDGCANPVSDYYTADPTGLELVGTVAPEDEPSWTDESARSSTAAQPAVYNYWVVARTVADTQGGKNGRAASNVQTVTIPREGRVVRVLTGNLSDSTLSKSQPNTVVDKPGGVGTPGRFWTQAGNRHAELGVERTVLAFDTSAVKQAAKVTDARLELFESQGVGSGATFDLHALTRSFVENEATWNDSSGTVPWSAPGGDLDPSPLASLSLDNRPKRVTFDTDAVRGTVQSWVDDSADNHGLLLKTRDESLTQQRVSFVNFESPDHLFRPRLVVEHLAKNPAETIEADQLPERFVPGTIVTVPATVTNTTNEPWPADLELSYRWTEPGSTEDITAEGDRLYAPLGRALEPGESAQVDLRVRTPINSDTGSKRLAYDIYLDLWDPTADAWFSDAQPLSPNTTRPTQGCGMMTIGLLCINRYVEDPTSNQLGLEDFLTYAGEETGGGPVALTNLYSGNLSWSYNAFANPSIGPSTFVRLTYNSQDATDPGVGYGVSVQPATLNRLGSRLSVPSGGSVNNLMTFIDGDGTTHKYKLATQSADLLTYTRPAGVQLDLTRDYTLPVDKQWVFTRPDGTRFYFSQDTGRQTSVVDRNGNTLSFTYDADGRLTSVQDASGRTTLTLGYDADGLVWIRDISGRALKFHYTPTHQLSMLEDGGDFDPATGEFGADAEVKAFDLTYTASSVNDNAKLDSVTDPLDHTSTIAYFTSTENSTYAGWPKTFTDRRSNVTEFAYSDPDASDAKDLVADVTDVNGSSPSRTTYRMDGFGRTSSIKDANANAAGSPDLTRLGWDRDHNVIRLTEQNGAVSTWKYDPDTGYPLEIHDAEAFEHDRAGTVLEYEKLTGVPGRPTVLTAKRSAFDGRDYTFTYDAAGNLATVRNGLGHGPDYSYDTRGLVTSITDANGGVTELADYDQTGNPREVTEPLGTKTSANPDDFVTSYLHDMRGNVLQVADPLGRVSTAEYDAFGRQTRVSTPHDGESVATTAYDYDLNDNVSVETAPTGAQTSYSYDEGDNVLTQTLPDNGDTAVERVVSRTYDPLGRMVEETAPEGELTPDPDDFVTRYTYDYIGQVTRVEAPFEDTDGSQKTAVTTYEYDDVGNLVAATEPKGNATATADDFTTKTVYDLNHRPTAVTDAAGYTTKYEYSIDGLLIGELNQLGNRTRTFYDLAAQPVKVRVRRTNPGDNRPTNFETVTDYDPVGNVVEVTRPSGDSTRTVYDANNRPVERHGAFAPGDSDYGNPPITYQRYDQAGQLTRVSLPTHATSAPAADEQWTRYSYWPSGGIETSTDPWDITTSYSYDKLGQQLTRSMSGAGDEATRSQSWSYHADGSLAGRSDTAAQQPVARSDNGAPWQVNVRGTWGTVSGGTNTVGADYRTHAAVDPGSPAADDEFRWRFTPGVTGTYDVFVSCPVRGPNAASDASYEVRDNQGSHPATVDQSACTADTPWVRLGNFSYTGGNPKVVVLKPSTTGVVAADAVRFVATGPVDTKSYEYSYDANGLVTEVVDRTPDASADRYEIGYDGLGRASSVTESLDESPTRSTDYSYDLNSNLVSVDARQLAGGSASTYTEYAWDVRNLVESVRTGESPSGALDTFSYTYDPRGLMASLTKPNGNLTKFGYYEDGLLHSAVERTGGGQLVSSHWLRHTADGDPLWDFSKLASPDGDGVLNQTTWYDYTPNRQVASVERNGEEAGKDESYVYDAAGNVVDQSIGGTATTFDYARGRLTSASSGGVRSAFHYDVFGRTRSVTVGDTGVERYGYDGFDRQVVHKRWNTAGVRQSVQRKVYDPFDRTVSETTRVGNEPTETTRFVYLGLSDRVAVEEEQDGAGQWQVSKAYHYGPDGQPIVLTDTPVDQTGPDRELVYGSNPHGDVESLTDAASGEAVATYRYTAYGASDPAGTTGLDEPTGDPAADADVVNPYRYSGHRFTAATGGYDFGFRDYQPTLGRFLTRDLYNGALSDLSLGLDPWNSNRYQLAGGNPISFIDLDGHLNDVIEGGGGGFGGTPEEVAEHYGIDTGLTCETRGRTPTCADSSGNESLCGTPTGCEPRGSNNLEELVSSLAGLGGSVPETVDFIAPDEVCFPGVQGRMRCSDVPSATEAYEEQVREWGGDPDSLAYEITTWVPIGGPGIATITAKITRKLATKSGTSALDALAPAVRSNVDDAIGRAAAGKVRFPGHDGKVYNNSDDLLPRGGNYTQWTAAQAGAKRGPHRIIIEGDPASPNAIYYWDHVNPPVRIGP